MICVGVWEPSISGKYLGGWLTAAFLARQMEVGVQFASWVAQKVAFAFLIVAKYSFLTVFLRQVFSAVGSRLAVLSAAEKIRLSEERRGVHQGFDLGEDLAHLTLD